MRRRPRSRRVEYEIGLEIPAEIRAALYERLGARLGDMVYLFSDGTVAIARKAGPEDARALTRHLRRLPPSAAACRAPRARRRRHLRLG